MIVGLYSTVPQSGKSTVSKLFVLAGFRKLSLATPVKQSLNVVLMGLGINDAHEYLWGERKNKVIPELGVTGGYLMSTYATDYFRNEIDPDVWLKILMRNVKESKNYIVDDMRFPNEYDAFDVRIKIVRENIDKRHGRSEKSEGQLDDYPFDYVINNNGTLAKLEDRARFIINRLGVE